jgi:excisionase family DNA binding protein
VTSTHDTPVVDQLLTVNDVTTRLRVSRQTLRRYVGEGRLPVVQLLPRGVWKFKARDVDDFIAQGERTKETS